MIFEVFIPYRWILFLIVFLPTSSFSQQLKLGPSFYYGSFIREVSTSGAKTKLETYSLKEADYYRINAGIKAQYDFSSSFSLSISPSFLTKATSNNQILCFPGSSCKRFRENRIIRFSTPVQVTYFINKERKNEPYGFLGINPYYPKLSNSSSNVPFSFQNYFLGFGLSRQINNYMTIQGEIVAHDDVIFSSVHNVHVLFGLSLLYEINY